MGIQLYSKSTRYEGKVCLLKIWLNKAILFVKRRERTKKPFKLRLILPIQKNTDSLSDGDDSPKQKRRFFIHNLVKLTFIELFTVASLVSVPGSVNAGVFSSLLSVFSHTDRHEVLNIEQSQNSQNMVLLRAAVNPNPDPAKGGGDITIVGEKALLAETGPSGTIVNVSDHKPTSGQVALYVVRKGDTLSEIAKMFGVTVNTIMWANGTEKATSIQPGETLVILPISGIRHTVQKGETLAGITKKYKGDLSEVLEYNGLSKNATLAVGDIVTIPDGEITSTRSTSASATSAYKGGGGPSYSGYYTHPLPGGIKTQGIHGYNGVDIGAPYGTPIVAAASGTVIISRDYGWNGGYGHFIVIRHDNGTQTLYAHNSSNIVEVGQTIVGGQVIGYVGSTGRSTGNHLHFEIRGAKNPF